MAVALACIVVLVVVLAVVFSCQGNKKTASSTTIPGSGTATSGAPVLSTYTAELTGDAEVNAVSTSATGTLTLTVALDGSSVDYVLEVSKITGVSVARLHEGKAGASGDTILDVFEGPAKTGEFSGTLAQGSFTAADLVGPLKGKTIEDLVTMILADSVYLNVGTSTHRSGEIRGQLKSSSSGAGSGTTIASTTNGSQPSGAQSLTDLIGQYKQVEGVSFDFKTTTPEGVTASGKMWEQAGKKLKIETTVSSVKNVMIIDLVANTMTVYQPATNQGMTTQASVPFQDPAGYADQLDPGKVQDLGTEVINGETCRVVQYTSTAGSTATVKIWLSESLGFPVKMTITTADGKTTTTEYTNIKVGALPSDTFNVPASVNITTGP